MAAGYSGRTLVEKLGIKPGTKITALGAPENYRQTLGGLPAGAAMTDRLNADASFVHAFVRRRAELERILAQVRSRIRPDGVIWISWPKRTSGVQTDVTEDTIREVAFGLQLVDVKVCAVDETWSGLKLVIRLAHRPPTPTG